MKFEKNKYGRVVFFHLVDGDVTMGNMLVRDAEKLFREGKVSTEIPDRLCAFGFTHCINDEYFFIVHEDWEDKIHA